MIIIVFFVFINTFISNTYSETVRATMRHLTADDGLSKSAGVSLLQDNQGFMWIGTYDGLNRYDGYQFKIYRPNAEDTTSLINNYINTIYEDNNRNDLWIGTREGLCRYSSLTETFCDVRLSEQYSAYDVTALYQDDLNRIWTGTQNGLCLIDDQLQPSWPLKNHDEISRGAITLFYSEQDTHIWLGSETGLYRVHTRTFRVTPIPFEGYEHGIRVWSMIRDLNGHLWVAGDRGLWIVHEASWTCKRPSIPAFRTKLIQNTFIRSLITDPFGNLWIGTWGEGVYRYHPKEKQLNRIVDIQSQNLPKHVFKLYKDQGGLIWIGSKTGIHLYDPYRKPFVSYPMQQNGRTSDWTVTKMIVQDPNHQNILWVSTDEGLMRTSLKTGQSRRIMIDSGRPYPAIHMLYMQPSGRLWLGTNGEILIYDTVGGRWIRLKKFEHPDHKIKLMSYYSILCDHQGIMWFGTFESGLIRFNPVDGSITFFLSDPEVPGSLPDDHIWVLFEDQEQRLWIGTDQGLALYQPETDRFKTYRRSNYFPMISNKIRVIQQDTGGVLWIGTDGGLCRFDTGTEEIVCYSEHDGLPNSVIHGIIEEIRQKDGTSAIWTSTNRGLSRFIPSNGSWTSFYKTDGLHGTEFSRHCYCKLQDGRLIFGGINGWTLFDPALFIRNPYPPKVALTDFELFHEPVPIGKPFLNRIFLNKTVSATSKIDLSHKHDIFGFEFTALHFSQPDKNQIQYRLEGFDTKWILSRGLRNATYTNLAPGKYTFQVKAANPDGIWSETPASIDIVIHPGFWQRWPVRILTFILIVAGIVFYYKVRTYQIRHRNTLLKRLNTELKDQVQERKRVETSLRDSKKQLTASLEEKEVLLKEIHHRVKNNLQVVKSLLSLQANHVIHDKDLEIFKESQDRIQAIALIHQKLYQSHNLAQIDFKDYIKSLVRQLLSIYQTRSQSIDVRIEVEHIQLSIDYAVPCGLIINELVTNAIKHAFSDQTVEHPTITVTLSQKKSGKMLLIVEDNGKGLSGDCDVLHAKTLGLNLVRLLALNQLEGELTVKRKGGTQFEIAFDIV